MVRFPTFAARALDEWDRPEAIALAKAQGPHGLYVHNALAALEGEAIGLYGIEALLGLCWFGPRGNLMVLLSEPLDPVRVASAVARAGYNHWRIALGPAPVIDVLRARANRSSLVWRDQVYYTALPADAVRALVRNDVRRPERADREPLMAATLLLNAADLNVDPDRVDRGWLRDSIDSRLGDGSTRVIGAPGHIKTKLDIGSTGPGGSMVEGVFTFPEARGKGFATGLVATCLAAAERSPVCLHVAADNAPARAAYGKAGMRAAMTVRLLLLS